MRRNADQLENASKGIGRDVLEGIASFGRPAIAASFSDPRHVHCGVSPRVAGLYNLTHFKNQGSTSVEFGARTEVFQDFSVTYASVPKPVLLASWFIGQLVGWLVGCLASWVDGWLVDRPVCWLERYRED